MLEHIHTTALGLGNLNQLIQPHSCGIPTSSTLTKLFLNLWLPLPGQDIPLYQPYPHWHTGTSTLPLSYLPQAAGATPSSDKHLPKVLQV